MSNKSILEFTVQRKFQLKQLERLNPKEAAKAKEMLSYGLVKSAIKVIVSGLKAQLKPAIDPNDQTHWPRTLGESIECLLGQDYEQKRAEREAMTVIRKPTNEESQRMLDLALRPGGGSKLHRPHAYFGKNL